MPRIPESISVEVQMPQGLPRSGMLVGITLNQGPRDYFSALLGLTDDAGRLKVSRDFLERDFAENQRLFPMDYKSPMEVCDNATIDITDGKDFAARRKKILASTLLSESARQLWSKATNPGVWASPVPIPIDGSPVSVTIVARKVGLP